MASAERSHDDAQSFDGRCDSAQACRYHQLALDLERRRSIALAKGPVAAKACGPKNDRMLGQIRRCERGPDLVEVSSRRGEDPRPCENSSHRCCRVRKRTKPKRDVHAFGHEVFALVSHHQVDPERRMPAHEVRKPWNNISHSKGRCQTDPQYSAQLSRSTRSVFRLVELG